MWDAVRSVNPLRLQAKDRSRGLFGLSFFTPASDWSGRFLGVGASARICFTGHFHEHHLVSRLAVTETFTDKQCWHYRQNRHVECDKLKVNFLNQASRIQKPRIIAYLCKWTSRTQVLFSPPVTTKPPAVTTRSGKSFMLQQQAKIKYVI